MRAPTVAMAPLLILAGALAVSLLSRERLSP
jgi:hypothetical protein